MLLCGIPDRQHPPLLTGSQVRFVFGKHALYTDMCDLDSELLLLSCRQREGSQEITDARHPSRSRHALKRKRVRVWGRRTLLKVPCGMASDGSASTRSPKLPHEAPLGNAIRSYIKRLNHDQRSRLTRHMLYLEGSLKVSSSCSGSGLLRIVAEYVMDEAGGEVDFVWSCESEPWKRRWICDMAVSHFSVVRRLFSRSDINYVNRRAHFCPCVSGTLSSLSGAVLCDQFFLLNEMSFLLQRKTRHRDIVEVVCGDHLKKSTPCNFVNICNMGTTTSECSAHALPGKTTATCTVRRARHIFDITCLCTVCRIVRSD